ncbi:MAG: hypothetical protein K9J83_02035 [Desulfarculaceae bacterium]|nr:hypothetical protein [Desulfarculaceae bacterium]
MTKNNKVRKEKPDPERKGAFESLPPHIRDSLTEEEAELFLYGEEWPDSLFEKMNEFIIKQS